MWKASFWAANHSGRVVHWASRPVACHLRGGVVIMVVLFGWFSRCRVVLFLIYIVVASGLTPLGSSRSSADEQTAGDAPKPTGQDRYFENSIGIDLVTVDHKFNK